MVRNAEGLTFSEWYAAATVYLHAERRPFALHVARQEWQACTDPAEWAAYLASPPARAASRRAEG